ncbi:amidohydrolase family protein [Engelhardtia mirabilis]|uniref:Amidohydrolase-related domain-containing protein n=1 Tax=Engelhardtia mirabilis TaxID=2528011 RepID=A0A518BKJ8_9BACT|nr:hypothetical protein Pla133_25850 [Planctomycetes bacterium Pla133]QDV01827.1 hypothetical protein Pla86_25840 [Planctomycetes bacterium Pla86]
MVLSTLATATGGALLLDLVALVGGTVHTMEPGAEPRVATVLLDGDRIAAIGEDIELAPGTVRIDVSGKHVVPGLIDCLVNFDPEHDALYLASGVTTVRDAGGDLSSVLALRDRGIRDQGPGPWLLSAGAVLDGYPPASAAALAIGRVEDVKWLVGELAKAGVDYLSVQPGISAEVYDQILIEAAAHELEVWGPRPTAVDLTHALEGGHRGFFALDAFLPSGVRWEFVLPIAFKSAIEQAAASNVAVVPVLAGVERILKEPADPAPELRYLAPAYEALWWTDWEMRKGLLSDENYRKTSERVDGKRDGLARELLAAGVDLIPGSAAPLAWAFPGRSFIEELEAWVGAGISPEDTLRAATATAARVLRIDDERGTLTPGKIADLVVIDTDPRESMAGFRAPEVVCVRGMVLRSDLLADMVEAIGRSQDVVREENLRPIAIELPELPEGDLLMGGQVSTRSLGSRLSSERFAVVRRLDGSLSFVGRMVIPASARYDLSTIDVEQIVVGGQLSEFRVRAVTGEEELVVAGRWDAGRFLFRRFLNGQSIDTSSSANRTEVINMDHLSDTITTALVVGQIETDRVAWVSAFGALYEPVEVRWEIQSSETGSRMIRTSEGGLMEMHFDARGMPTGWVRVIGGRQSATILEAAETFGGAGLPVRFPRPKPVEAGAPAAGGPGAESPSAGAVGPPAQGSDLEPAETESGVADGPESADEAPRESGSEDGA